MELFETIYRPAINAKAIQSFDLYTMDDATEQDDDCARIYHKSLLYLVSNAFEQYPRIPTIPERGGVPPARLGSGCRPVSLRQLFNKKEEVFRWLIAPGPATNARHHGDFDNDKTTLLSTLERIIGSSVSDATAVLASRKAAQIKH